MFCDPSGVRSTHSLLGLDQDPRGSQSIGTIYVL